MGPAHPGEEGEVAVFVTLNALGSSSATNTAVHAVNVTFELRGASNVTKTAAQPPAP